MPPYVPPYQEDEGESSEGDSISVSSSNNHELELYRQSKPGIQNTFSPSDIPRHPKPLEDRHVPLARREKIRDYRAPQDGNGKPLSSNIYIYGQAAEDLKANFIGAYQWPISPGCDGPKTARRNLLSITSARRWFDDSKHRIDITCSANLERWATPMGSHTMWLHVERQKQTMEEFEVIASNIPELPENWKLLIRGAFKKFRDNPDFDAHVGWVFRADAIESDWIRDREAPPTVTCISIPYFFLGPKDDHESPGRSLYQWEDPKESSRQWDAYQSYPKMADEKDSKSRIIYIRTIWALIAGHVVLTYGPMDFDDLTDGFIEQIVPKPNAMTSPDVVQVTDLNGCNHILSMRECRTFFDLTQAIVDQIILKQPLPSAGDVEYISSDGLVLDGSSWLTTVQSETSEMVKIRLRHTPEPAPKSTSLQRLPSHVSELKGVKESKGVSATVHVDAQNTDDSDGHYLDSSGNESRAMILHSHGSELRPTSEPTEFTKIGYPTSLVISEQLASKAYPDYPSRSGLHTGRTSPPGSRERKQQRKRAETPPGDSSNLHRSNDLKRNKELLINQNTTKNLPSIFKPLDMNSAGASHRFEQRSNSPNLSRAEPPEISSRDQQNGRKVSTGLANGDSSEQKDRNSAHRDSASTRLEIQPPPFLSWASSPETSFKYDTEASRTGLEYVERILESIHIILKETQSTRNRRLYRRALEINDTELQKSFPFLEFTKIRLTQSQNTPEFKKSEASTTGQQTLESFGFDDIDSADLVHSHLLKGISKATEELFQLYRKFLSLYVPLFSTHEILQKCWGAFHSILSTIQKGIQRDKEMREQSEPTYWVVRDIANDPALSQNLKKAFLPWTECGSCRSGRIYREYSESERHVKMEHFGISDKGGKQPELPRHTLKAWLRDNHQYRTDQRLNLYQTYLTLALDQIRTLFYKAKSIRDAAINTQAPQITRYLLPRSLVASFENAIMMLLYTSNAVITVSRYSNHFQENKQSTEKDQEATALLRRVKEDLEASGHAASNSMDSAVKDILLMTLTDVDTRIVRYDEVGPEYIVAAVLDKLCNRPLHKTERIEQVYSSFVRKLSLDARAHPRRRIIGDIWHLQEEVNIVRSIVHTQSMLMYDYIEVINPRHFPTTSYERSYRFNAENQFLFHAENERNRAWKELYTLESRLVTLKRHVLQMLEVQRESDGNALLVFTVVSVIFLPLSWATSYLGMNTKDIRDMEKDQWLFWAIAVPITSLVIGLAILVLLKGDDLREFILTRSTARSRGSDKTQELHESLSMKAPTMVSTYNEEKTQLRGWNRPRRRRGAGFGSKV